MGISTFVNIVKELINIQKITSVGHQKLILLIKDIDRENPESPNIIKVARPLCTQMVSTSNSLADNDQQMLSQLESLQNIVEHMKKVRRLSKSLKIYMFNIEKYLQKQQGIFSDFLKDFEPALKSVDEVCKEAKQKKNNDLKIKTLLKKLIQSDVIDQYEKTKQIKFPIQLLPTFYMKIAVEEPEIEMKSDSENKRISLHMNFLLKSLEQFAYELFKIYGHLDLQDSPKVTLSHSSKAISVDELKSLYLKINRLHNRGSLTDDEAKRMLSKISVLPVSPVNESSAHTTTLKKTQLLETEDFSVYESRDKSIYKSLDKLTTFQFASSKKLNKSISPGKSLGRNTSLPKVMIASKAIRKKCSRSKSPAFIFS